MKYWQPEKGTLYNGESLEVLKTLKDESVNCVITSPPYWGLRDYGTGVWEGGDHRCDHKMRKQISEIDKNSGRTRDKPFNICPKCGAKRIDKQLGLEKTFQEYITRLCNIFDEVKRILTKDGTVWVVIGDTYAGSGKGAWDNKDAAKEVYVPDKKPDIKTDLPDKCLCLIPSRFSIEMCNRGWILRNKNIWHKANCMPSSVKDRFTVDYEEVFLFVKNKKYYFKQQFEKQLAESYDRLNRGISNKHKNLDVPGQKIQGAHKARSKGNAEYLYNPEGRNKRTVWQINPKPFPDAHFAVFPEELVETPIKAGCPKDGVVMDIFMGSGTVAKVAKKMNMEWIGIDLNKKFCDMTIRGVEKTVCQFPLMENII